ncbi:pyridoxal phosphate-dependent aminotransferase [Orrella sp. JC864]|uniref:pyridoxal phosphate-dependent aminotransferase n=1 Tax=Orrella sp. JC864 TaxID=3120298 RepID=UPI00300909AE
MRDSSGTITAQRLASIKPSPSISAKARVDALRAEGRKIIDFTVGEPDLATPSHIVAAGAQALANGHTRYTGPAGTPQLRQAIAGKLACENGLSYDAAQIVVGSGAKQIIFNALAASLNEGDEVVIPAPYWVSYPDMVALCGGVPVVVPAGQAQHFKLTAAQLAAAITPRTRWVVLNTPNNPTGAVYSHEELRALCDVLLRHPHVWLMTDEIYEHFVYGGVRHVSPQQVEPALRERMLLVNGFSKAYAMTGWRIGYGAGPRELVKAITLLITQSTTCPNAAAQAAAVAALQGPQQCVAEAAQLFGQRRERLVRGLNQVPGVRCDNPQGAFYVFPHVGGLIGAVTSQGQRLQTDLDVAAYFLEAAGVALMDGTSYGMSPYLRLSFATSLETIDEGCQAMAHAAQALELAPAA